MHNTFKKLDDLKSDAFVEWSQPAIYDLSDQKDVQLVDEAIEQGNITTVYDPIEDIANDLFERRHPEHKDDELKRSLFVTALNAEGYQFGKWAHFNWSNSLVRYPSQVDHLDLRTSRNRMLDTETEQHDMYDKTIAVFGLSVGSNIVDQLVQSGIGNHYIIGDFDTLSPSNLNRVKSDMSHVGMKKIDISAQKVSETDPYIVQSLERNGFTPNTAELLHQERPSVIVDEVDDLQVKAWLREYARRTRTPLLMVADIDDKSVLHVERHDLEQVKPFKGAMSDGDFDDLLAGNLSPDKAKKAFVKTAGGLRHISPKMIQSALMIEKGELTGLPQRGSTATAGATLMNIAVREILLGRNLSTGTYVHDPRKELKLSPATTASEAVGIYKDYIKSLRNKK